MKKEITIVAVMLVCVLFLMPTEAQALTGIQANEGTKSNYFGEVHKSYDSSVYNPVWWYGTSGNFYTKGHLAAFGVTKVLDYWIIIQIKPEDSSHKYLRIKTDSAFHYGLSAGLGYANWKISYSLVNTDQSSPIEEARSWYQDGDSVGWGGVKNNKHYYAPNEYYWLYEYMGFVTSSAYVFSPNEWYYVGIHISVTLNGYSDLYRYSSQSGNAYLDINSISWEFTTYYEQPP